MKHLKIYFIILFSTLALILDAQSLKPIDGALEWREVGPYRGGRSCAVSGVPGKPNLFYFGATGGGVWKTTDGGRSWENISDGFFGGSIGAIAVSPSDPNVIYVGGGEKTVRGNVSSGYGIWKSEDAGKTWQSMGLKTTRHISRIRIHPNDHNILWIAAMGNLYKDNAERGIYKSIDGGQTWEKKLYINASVGAVDLELDPNNPRIMYASTWKVRRTPYDLSSGGEGSALWKSTDSGNSWNDISKNEGLPKGIWGINGVTVSPANSDRIWCIIENKDGGLFRSDDGGKKWNKVNSQRSLRQRAWYYTRIYADPEDYNTVYVLNVNYHKSTDGGKSFESARAPHGDHHDLWIAPENSDRMIIGDDGGAQVTYDGGATWTTYHNQPTAQFYRVTTDNHFPYRIYAAQQDNSTIRILHRTNGSSINDSHWESTAGGESAHITVDPTNNEIVYGGSYGGFLTRLDHTTGFNRAINVYPDNPMGYGAEGMKYRFQWNFPIFFSKHDPKKLYTCSNYLHLSTNQGQSWDIISPDLTTNDSLKMLSSGGPITKDNTGVEYYCTIFAADESPLKEGLIWTGSDDGLVHLTQNGGQDWSNVTSSNFPENLMINCIEPSPFDEASCYLAGTLYKEGDFKPYLFKTSNYGKSWTKIVQGIDVEHFTRAIRVDPNEEGVLYAGTETGMYISFNDGQNWESLQLNLPVVPITDLRVKNDNLIAATQGRGIWMIDDLTVLRQARMVKDQTQNLLFQPMDSYRMAGGQNKNIKGAGKNHPSGVMTFYYLHQYDETKDTITLSYLSEAGDTIRQFSNHSKEKSQKLDCKAGANVFNWNMRYNNAKKFEGMILWWGSLAGAKVLAGQYQVSLAVNGKSQSQNFNILKDPRVQFTDRQLESQIDFIQNVNSKVSDAHQTIQDIRDLKKQMGQYKKLYTKGIDRKIEQIDSTLSLIENELYQTKNQSRQDPLNYPIKLSNKLAHLNSLIQISDAPPTDQMYEVLEVIGTQIDEQINRYEEIINTEIVTLNTMIKNEVIDFIKPRKEEDK